MPYLHSNLGLPAGNQSLGGEGTRLFLKDGLDLQTNFTSKLLTLVISQGL